MVGMAAARELLYSTTDHFFTHFDFPALMNLEVSQSLAIELLPMFSRES
jgi:hypothetical protein